ncbi:MAG: peptidylprolyl isomerase [Rickettsiales bacterium]|nr:peptidylprolyl isomerase [Rickettsiales bacterium]
MRLISLVSSVAMISFALLTSAHAQSLNKPSIDAVKAGSKEDYILLRVNGESISRSRVLTIWKDLFPEGKAPDFDSFDEQVRMNVLRGIVSEQLVAAEAKKSGVETSSEVTQKLAKLKEKLITQAFLDQKASTKVNEQEIRTIYDKKALELKGQEEINARHILVDSEDKAIDIADEIDDGAKFEDVAKKESLDKGTGIKGGDLGWFTEERMVPEFSTAAFKLKAGELSKPVKTSFGWHIIQVQERRPVQVPPFEQVKDSIAQELKSKALKSYINELLGSAKVEYFAPDGSQKTFNKDAPASSKE